MLNEFLAMNILKQVAFVFGANALGLLTSCASVFILPSVLNLTDYGYFRLFLFYSSFFGLATIGWTDGIFLKLGGIYYEKLNFNKLSVIVHQFYIFQFILLVIGFAISFFVVDDNAYCFLINAILITFFIMNCRGILILILQATGKVKEYSNIQYLERSLFLIFIVLLFYIEVENYEPYVEAIILADLISLFYTFTICHEFFRSYSPLLQNTVSEILEYIKIGYKLLVANLCSMFVIGVFQQEIVMQWGAETFGKIALILSISAILITFFNAFSVVLFPILRRIKQSSLALLYRQSTSMLTFLGLLCLFFYYPIVYLFPYFFPQFADNIKYLIFLLPLSVFEAKMSILVNSYLRTLRKENLLLYINVSTFILSIILSSIAVFYIENLDITIYFILLVIAIRSVLSEFLIGDFLCIRLSDVLCFESLLIGIFVGGNWFFSFESGFLMYLTSFIIYLLIFRKKIDSSLMFFRRSTIQK